MNLAFGFEELPPSHDLAVARASGIDRFCSSSCWALPALQAFHPNHEPVVRTFGDVSIALARSAGVAPFGRALVPLEAIWGLAAPIAAPDANSGALATEAFLSDPALSWDIVMLCGLYADGALLTQLIRLLQGRYRLRPIPRTTRHCASLEGGLDGFLARRSRKFRANLRRISNDPVTTQVEMQRVSLLSRADVVSHFDRVTAIERQSWKAAEGNGADSGAMAYFTFEVLARSAERGGALLIFATLDGCDVGYLHGAVSDAYFRGLQMSFVERMRPLGLGNALQVSMITWLCELGVAEYDLGSELPYKRRWAEKTVTTNGMVITR